MPASTEILFTLERALDFMGTRVNPYELEEDGEGILAILPDDQIVEIVDWTRISVGHGGATVGGTTNGEQWGYRHLRNAPKGLYERMKGLMECIAIVRAERLAAKKGMKRWDQSIYIVGYEALTDDEIADMAVQDGWLGLLRNFRA